LASQKLGYNLNPTMNFMHKKTIDVKISLACLTSCLGFRLHDTTLGLPSDIGDKNLVDS
jgi:hypothetical protein